MFGWFRIKTAQEYRDDGWFWFGVCMTTIVLMVSNAWFEGGERGDAIFKSCIGLCIISAIIAVIANVREHQVLRAEAAKAAQEKWK